LRDNAPCGKDRRAFFTNSQGARQSEKLQVEPSFRFGLLF
jgi:hypothetical protein